MDTLEIVILVEVEPFVPTMFARLVECQSKLSIGSVVVLDHFVDVPESEIVGLRLAIGTDIIEVQTDSLIKVCDINIKGRCYACGIVIYNCLIADNVRSRARVSSWRPVNVLSLLRAQATAKVDEWFAEICMIGGNCATQNQRWYHM